MNKSELLASMAEKGKITKVDAERALNAFIQKVQLVGFGTFEARERKARSGRNPRNPKEVIKIPASKAPVFKAGKSLKEIVNK